MDYSRYNTEKQRKRIRSGAIKSRKKIGFNIFRLLIIIVILASAVGVAAGIGGFYGVIDSAPTITADDVMPNKLKSVLYYPDGKEAVELIGAQSNRTIVTIGELPKHLPEAFIAIEDQRFYEHKGIDPKGIVRALFVALASHGDFSQGASTITQQLIKLTIFDGGAETDTMQRFKRKFQEWYLALQLEKELSKDQIMEAYLNTINLGRGAYGIQSAAERYFNKDASELTISECAVIAAIAQSPSYNNPIDGQIANSERRNKILSNMLTLGFITQEEYETAMADKVYARIKDVNESMADKETIYTWFEDAVIDQVLDDLQDKLGYTDTEAANALFSGGLQIYMTQNRRLQSIVDSYYRDDDNFSTTEYRLHWALTYTDSDGTEHNIDENTLQSYYGSDSCDLLYYSEDEARESIAEFEEAMDIKQSNIVAENFNMTVQAQSSFVLMDQSNGQVLALSGGRGEKTTNRSFNRATQATRQPGSVFKPIAVFLPALDACKLTLASTKVDEPYKLEDGTEIFNTDSSSYSGTTTIRNAITYSMNVVTTKWLVEDVTPKLGIQYLQKLGISTVNEEQDAYPTLGLGGIYTGVTNLELTGAYAAIANGGVYNQPILYTKILDKDGNVLIDNIPEQRTVMRPSTAYLLTSAMEDVVDHGTATPAQISNYGIAEAGKTGTTEEYRDLWFVGFTPYYTAGIWLGYDDSISMRGRISYSYSEHKYLWANIMDEVLEGLPDKDFTMPSDVVRASVCKNSGKLASSGCSTITEYFATEDLPTEYCSDHTYVTVAVCSKCGLKATSLTPDDYVTYKYYDSYSDAPGSYCSHTQVETDKAEAETKESEESPNPPGEGEEESSDDEDEDDDDGDEDDDEDSDDGGEDEDDDDEDFVITEDEDE